MKTTIQLTHLNPLSTSAEIKPETKIHGHIHEQIEVNATEVRINNDEFNIAVDVNGIYTGKNDDGNLISKVTGTYRLIFRVDVGSEIEKYTIDTATEYLNKHPEILNSINMIQSMYISKAIFDEIQKMGIKSTLPLTEMVIESV